MLHFVAYFISVIIRGMVFFSIVYSALPRHVKFHGNYRFF